MIAALARDVHLAARALRRRPGFTLTAGLTLALGIGATAAAAALLGSVLFQPLPYAQPARLVSVWDSGPWGGTNQVSPPNFADWVDQARSFEAIGAFQREEFSVTGEGEPDRLPGQRVTAGVFDVLGVEAARGRRVQAADVPGGKVVVLSDGLWQRRFGRDPGVVGRSLHVDGEPHEIVGVMPPGFRLPGAESAEWTDAALWAPIEQDPRSRNRGAHGMIVLARLRSGVAVADARQEMAAIAARLAAAYPDTNRGWSAKVIPLHERVVGHVRRPLAVLSGGLVFLLLIACANVSHMLLARGVQRTGEMSVRAALGASRGRLVRQLLAEAAVLWMVGAAGGLLIARWALEAVRTLAPASLPRLGELALPPAAVAAALALSLAVMLAAAAAPALVTAGDGTGRLQAASRSVAASRRSLRGALVVSEVALSLVLLAGAGLLLRSWQRLHAVDPGFDPAGVWTFRVSAPPSRYPTAAERAPFYDRVLERLRALPQVQAVGAIGDAPLTGGEGFWQAFFRREGERHGPEHEGHDAYVRWIAPGYFETVRIPLLRGRAFDAHDRGGSTPVVIVDRTLAERHFKDRDPLGQRIAVSIGPDGVWREIVGVVGEVRQTAMDRPPMEHVYLPHGQSGRWLPHMTVTLRARGEAGLVERLRREVHAVDPETPVYGLEPMAALVQRSVATRRFQTLLLTVFAAVALGLTAVGVYGVLAQSVAQRRREVGIRMAVGARRGDVVRMVVGEGMMMAVAGVALGLLGAAAMARVIAGLLFEVGAWDAVAYAGAAAVLAAAALAASYVPARRAAGVDPVRVLRQD
jgi:putative ABC transport system permease protein